LPAISHNLFGAQHTPALNLLQFLLNFGQDKYAVSHIGDILPTNTESPMSLNGYLSCPKFNKNWCKFSANVCVAPNKLCDMADDILPTKIEYILSHFHVNYIERVQRNSRRKKKIFANTFLDFGINIIICLSICYIK